MIKKITKADRERNPKATRGKTYKLISVKDPGKVLGYFKTIEEAEKREGQVEWFKHHG